MMMTIMIKFISVYFFLYFVSETLLQSYISTDVGHIAGQTEMPVNVVTMCGATTIY